MDMSFSAGRAKFPTHEVKGHTDGVGMGGLSCTRPLFRERGGSGNVRDTAITHEHPPVVFA